MKWIWSWVVYEFVCERKSVNTNIQFNTHCILKLCNVLIPFWFTRIMLIMCLDPGHVHIYRSSFSDWPTIYSISQEICTRFLLCCALLWFTLTDFPISIRLTSLALWQSNDCPSASKATLMNMDKYFMWIHYERLHNHNKAKHNKTVCIFLGIYCMKHNKIVCVFYGIHFTCWAWSHHKRAFVKPITPYPHDSVHLNTKIILPGRGIPIMKAISL